MHFRRRMDTERQTGFQERTDAKRRTVSGKRLCSGGWRKRAAGVALAALLAFGVLAGNGIRAEAAPLAKGLDVSVYQKGINWSAVKNAGYDFAFVKIGSAKSGLDPFFAANMLGASAVGMKVGAYVYSYATTVEGAITEAQFAIAALAPFSVSLPVVYDLEDTVHKNMTPDQLAALTVAFCTTVQAAGYYPMLYASRNWAAEKIAAVPFDKWIAQYSDSCTYPGPAFWQFSSKGSVPGIEGNVDLNFQFKDFSGLIVANGFVDRGGKTYYYRNYRMQFGFVEDNGRTYFMNADGSMYKQGWIGDGVNMFYMDTSDGHMLHDLVTIAGKNYYFLPNGLMYRGILPLDGKVYLFGADGAMYYGFYEDPAAGVRYFGEDGNMAVNVFLDMNGGRYYFNPAGIMSVGLTPVGTDIYLFGVDGKMQFGWYADAAGMRYFTENGTMAVNTALTLDGLTYQFDANGIATVLPVMDPAGWIVDPVTGAVVDSVTGQPVDPALAAQVMQQALEAAQAAAGQIVPAVPVP